jgi:hypothetical protein
LPGIDGGIGRGLQAYRSNAKVLSAKTLAGVYPRLREELGEASFDAMAWAFWRVHPPLRGDLAQWGAELVDFLARQPGMDVDLLELSRLQWACHQAEQAADAELDIASLDLLSSTEAGNLGLRLRPGLLLLPRRGGQTLLVWRRQWRAQTLSIGPGQAGLMRALLDGTDLESALGLALAADPRFDFSDWLQAALREAWLQGAYILPEKEQKK